MMNELNELEVKEIKEFAREKLGRCRKGNDIIGAQIFFILRLNARLIFYPLGKDAPWGFTRISGSRNDAQMIKPFVAINSSIPADCQVFAAAHELYHIWYEQNPYVLPTDLLNEKNKELSERKANRFAAEFLVDEQLLKQEIDTYQIKNYTIKDVLQLAALFFVPYRTMVKRLYEISVISDAKANLLLSESDESLEQYRKRYSIAGTEPDEHVMLDNLVDLAISAYERHLITYEKLEYLLEISRLCPADFGIEPENDYSFPSDDELDSIMEE